jgi:hypothetical protein
MDLLGTLRKLGQQLQQTKQEAEKIEGLEKEWSDALEWWINADEMLKELQKEDADLKESLEVMVDAHTSAVRANRSSDASRTKTTRPAHFIQSECSQTYHCGECQTMKLYARRRVQPIARAQDGRHRTRSCGELHSRLAARNIRELTRLTDLNQIAVA